MANYGKNSVPGVTTDIQLDATQGVQGDVNVDNITTQIPGIDIYGHQILIRDDGMECLECEMEEEIPEVFLKSSGFYEVVYKLYIFGKFKHSRCETEMETDNSILHDDTTNVGYDPNKVHWVGGDTYTTNGSDVKWQVPQGQRMMLDGKEYTYDGDGKFVESMTGQTLDVDELQHRHGQDASYKIADSAQRQDYQRDALNLGQHDFGIDAAQTRIDQVQQPDVTVQGDDLTEQAEQTLKEKAARHLKNKRNSLIR